MIAESSLPWTYDLDQAIRLQENMRRRVLLTWDDRIVRTIAGIEVSYAAGFVRAAIAVFSYPGLTHRGTVSGETPEAFPYIPGLLAFRAGPAILKAWEKLKQPPDLVLIHGHGTAHPRHFGLASHIGLWINLPAIGVAKTRLYGTLAEVGAQVGEWSEIRDERSPKQVIGAAVRTRPESKPVYVSPGHLIDLPHSVEFVLAACRKDRLPLPIQAAHHVLTAASSKEAYDQV